MSFRLNSMIRWTLAVAAALALIAGVPVGRAGLAQTSQLPGQLGGPPPNTLPGRPSIDPGFPSAGVPPRMAAAAARARNNERQQKLVADSDKLLALATQLHADVARTDKDILSVDVVKRAEEIERLAHSVKERMRGA